MGYTNIAQVEATYLHGEMVSMGLIAQLTMQQDTEQADRVTRFLARVGLPVHLGQFDLSPDMDQAMQAVVDSAMTFPHLANLPFPVTAQKMRNAIVQADQLGRKISDEVGDQAYRRLHAS